MDQITTFDVVVVGGGPAGATAANELAQMGLTVMLLDRAGRIKPCGGAVPPQMLKDFNVPREVLEAEVSSARMISPSNQTVDMPIDIGYVGMVDRGEFDEWLRERARHSGAVRQSGTFLSLGMSDGKTRQLQYAPGKKGNTSEPVTVKAHYIIGADGAKSRVARAAVPGADKLQSVFAYHEIVEAPQITTDPTLADDANADAKVDPSRCDVIYNGEMSPDFYSWVFPHGKTISVGTGTAVQGFGIRQAVTRLRQQTGLDSVRTIRTEGAPIPMKPLKVWDDGQHVVLAGDAAGVVAPASGEGIFYAMTCGRMVAEVVAEAMASNNPACLKMARKRFLAKHGKVFWVLGIMQRFWYSSDKRRERFVTMCDDADVQRLTWESYLNKRLVRRDPLAHLKIFIKDVGHLLGLVSATKKPS
ncbi:MAG: geranylgeranyl diphosphate reductase [Granulosicoccus sp.]|nr:geranylgeranyl diphosphate reductase [Granulosicoccus sp.]